MTAEEEKLLAYAKALLKSAGRSKDKRRRTHELAEFWYDVEVTINYAKGF